MFRIFKYLFLCFLALCLLAIIFWKLSSQQLATYTAAKVSKIAIANNIFLNFAQSSFGLLNFQSKMLTVEIANSKVPLNFELENLKINPVLTSILSSRPMISFGFKLQGGDVHGKAFMQDGKIGLRDLQVRKVECSEISFLKLLGFSAGEISLDLEELFIEGDQPAIKFLSFELSNFVKKETSVIPSMISGLPMNITLEPIEIKKLSAIIYKESVIQIKDLLLDSDWGTLSANFLFKQKPNRIEITEGQGSVSLKDLGSKQLSPFLPLFSKQQLNSGDQAFSFQFVDYQSGFPHFNFTVKN